MLVLTRHAGERVRINKNIVVTVERIRGNKVRLSFEAPREVKILRDELDEFPQPAVPVTFPAGPINAVA